MESENFYYQDALDLAGLIRKKKISVREVMQAYLDRIAYINPKLNAIIAPLGYEKALELANKADEQLARSEKIGLFHGLPHAVKDLEDVKGWPTTRGWKAAMEESKLAFLEFWKVLEVDGLLAERMREAGLLFIGKTNVPDFGMGSHTKNELFGVTRNPYNPSLTVGGSSGGAACGLATGMLPIADGSDMGGSLRNPAAFCNVVGFRPSIGRVPTKDGDFDARIATEGPMGRSVRDVAALLSVQAGAYDFDPLSINESGSQFLNNLMTDVKGKKVVFTPDFGSLLLEPEIVEVSSSCVPVLEQMGVIVEQGRDTYPKLMKASTKKGEMNAMDVFRTLRVMTISKKIRALRATIGVEGIRKYCNIMSQYQMIEAFEEVDAEAIYAAMENRTRILGLFSKFFEKYDFLICPTTQVVQFPVETDYVRTINGQPMKDYLQWMSICCIFSITGLPVISMPCGFTDTGLPVGIQIVGQPQMDFELLQFAQAFEDATQFSAKFVGRRPEFRTVP